MSLSLWAKSKAGSKANALAELAELPILAHGVAHPFDYDNGDAYKKTHTNVEINAAIDRAPIASIPLAGLLGTQHSVKPPQVRKYIEDPDRVPLGTRDPEHGGLIDYPIVVQQDGKRFIHDGHHRLTAAVLMGEKAAKVRFVDFDKAGTK